MFADDDTRCRGRSGDAPSAHRAPTVIEGAGRDRGRGAREQAAIIGAAGGGVALACWLGAWVAGWAAGWESGLGFGLADAVCVGLLAGGFGLGVGAVSVGCSAPCNPMSRDMRSSTPPDWASPLPFPLSPLDENKLPNRLPEPPGAGAGRESAEARLMVLPVGVSTVGSPGGLILAGIEPGSAGDEMRFSVPPWACTAARNTGFMPPSVPMRTGTVGVPRLTRSANWASSRCCLSLAAATTSSGCL